MKKILFVIPTLRDGGAERSLVNLLCELPSDKYEIDLLLFKNKGIFLDQVPSYVNILKQPNAIEKLYAPIHQAGAYMPIKVIGNGLSKVLKRGMGEQKAFVWEYFYKHVIPAFDKVYDVAVGYLGGESTYYIVDKVKAKRRIHWVHNDYRTSGMPKKYDMKLFNKVDSIVTISDECLEILHEEFPTYTDKCVCIANITSASAIQAQAEQFVPEEFEGEDNVLVSIGRLSEQKGFDIAISAAAKMKEKGIRFKWFILGSGPLKDKLCVQIEKENIADSVILLGSKTNPYPYIKNCDIFVQPSRFEGKSVVIDEAKILAKPILVTNYPTVKDQITSENEGVIVGLNSTELAEGLADLLKDKEHREALHKYLSAHNYGNQDELRKYIELFDCEDD